MGGQVVISVVGSYITRSDEHHFVRGFVLQPTLRREGAYFVLSEWLRVTNVVPDRAVRKSNAVEPAASNVHAAVAAAPAPSEQPEPRERASRAPKRATAIVTALPKRCTLGDVKGALEKFGTVKEVKRIRNDAVVEFATFSGAKRLVAAGEFKINELAAGERRLITGEEFDQMK